MIRKEKSNLLRSERTLTLLQMIQDKWYERPMKEANSRLFADAPEWERLAMVSIMYLACITILAERIRTNPHLAVENCINLLDGAPLMADLVQALRALLRTTNDAELIFRCSKLVDVWEVEAKKAAKFSGIIRNSAPKLRSNDVDSSQHT
jgi:hypothetical protein